MKPVCQLFFRDVEETEMNSCVSSDADERTSSVVGDRIKARSCVTFIRIFKYCDLSSVVFFVRGYEYSFGFTYSLLSRTGSMVSARWY